MRTSHMGELFTAAFQIVAVLGLHRVLDGTRDGIIDAENGALDELYLPSSVPAETIGTGDLPLTPCFRRTRLTACIRRRNPAGITVDGRRVLKRSARVISGRPMIRFMVGSSRFGTIIDVRFRQAVGG